MCIRDSCWAICMVLAVVKPSLREASCCRFEVVNGAAGFLRRSLARTLFTSKRACSTRAFAAAASCSLCSSAFLPSSDVRRT